MSYKQFEKKIGYRFKNRDLVQNAFCHRSYLNEQFEADLSDNERLEFLGDAVLSLVASDILMKRYPQVNEGELSRMRSNLVSEAQLAEVARGLDLGEYISLGKGELQTGGRDKNSILANTMEAVIAAIYLDGGFRAAFRIVAKHFNTLFDASASPSVDSDYKSRLQEVVQNQYKITPKYKVIKESGPDHDKTFVVELKIGDIVAKGKGKSKKAAEQNTAKKCLQQLGKPSRKKNNKKSDG